MPSKIKEMLGKNQLVRVFGMGQLCYPKLVEIVGLHAGWDAVWFDQEHAGLSVEQIEHASRAARVAGLDSFVRLPPTDYATVMRPLESGSGGIMAAQVRSAMQTAEIVSWCKFHPEGQRGVNATGVDGNFGSLPLEPYFKRANADTFIAIQIEHADALADVDQIAAVPGVDVLFIGPADLSQSLGIPAQWNDPKLWDALERVAKASAKSRIHWAILPPSLEHARRCVDMGCRMLSLGMDVWAMHKGMQTSRRDYEEFFAKAVN